MRALRAFISTMRDIRIYELNVNMVEHVYTLGDVVCKQSQTVGVEATPNCCIVLIGKSCKKDTRDFLVCREIARLCSGVGEAQLFMIFTQPASILDTMYPMGEDDDYVEGDLPGVPWQATVIGSHATRPGGSDPSRSMQDELKAMLARDLPALRSTAEGHWSQIFKIRTNDTATSTSEAGLGHLRFASGGSLSGNQGPMSPSKRKGAKQKGDGKQRYEQLDFTSLVAVASSLPEDPGATPEADAEQEYNGILGEIYVCYDFLLAASNEAFSNICTFGTRFTTCLDRISLDSIPRTGRASCAITWTSPHLTAFPLQTSCTRTRKECSPERSLMMHTIRSGTRSGRPISSRLSQQAMRLMTHSTSARLNWQRYVRVSSHQRCTACAHMMN